MDEINSLSLAIQAALLRVLQNQTYCKVGGNRELAFNARLIVASNHNLLEEIRLGNFRQDLFYRINVVTLEIPPLRKRKGDIYKLSLNFLNKCSHQLDHDLTITEDALDLMLNYSWPGNVRELENMIERCGIAAFSRGVNIIDSELLSYQGIVLSNIEENKSIEDSVLNDSLFSLDLIEKQAVERALKSNQNNISQTAKILGITRSTLYKKLKKYGISP